LGDCLELLKTLPSDYFDSCVSDVPYGLGPKEPTTNEIVAYIQGAELNTQGDFMGKKWAIPSVNVWKEVFRVLKPGAHLLSFGGTRTFDLISLGLRVAGFQNRDTIASNYPGIQWTYASGMPKSTNVGKAIAALEVPTEAEKEAISGWGSGLKPSWEPILVFRKPFKGPLFKNVLQHGTGALNIDATRVAHSSKEDFERHKLQVEAVRARGGVREDSWKNTSDLCGANEVTEAGRWPANSLFSHHPQCERLDAAWVCAPGCPVAHLDAQSGDRPSTLTGRADPHTSHTHPGTEFNENSTFLGKRTHHSNVYADSGGASRFFAQFQQELEAPFYYSTKANRMEASMGEFKVKHVTLKPIKLMQYLVRLVTPKGGVVLDPYCGSGTTCHAALLEGCSYVGIERDPEAHDEATRRMAIVQNHVEGDQHTQGAFDLMMGGDV
jgi:site-specific DNA-methyltransferase (adenine-specific)